MITKGEREVTFRFNDEEVIQSLVYLMKLNQYLKKKNRKEEEKDTRTAIEVIEWAYVKLFSEDWEEIEID